MPDVHMTKRVPAAMTLPANGSPLRRAGSVRRTSHIDMLLGHHPGLVLSGAARDMVTDSSGARRVVAEARVTAGVGSDGTLVSLDVQHTGSGPAAGDTQQVTDDTTDHNTVRAATNSLVGLAVSGGFRDAVRRAFPTHVEAGSTLALLLDDLPVAALISGYALLYQGAIPADSAAQSMKSDICSGWRAEGTMMTSVRAGEGVPVTLGPTAPSITEESVTDPLGWHAIGDLPVGAMRRRRLVDVTVLDDAWEVTALFRDTHVGPDGAETVLHEYSLAAAVDADATTFSSCSAVPRVLPWVECPVAAASADRLVGRRVDDVRDFVRSSLRGRSTCTHLNDLLRSLGDVTVLAHLL
jgi:hypothetical protein